MTTCNSDLIQHYGRLAISSLDEADTKTNKARHYILAAVTNAYQSDMLPTAHHLKEYYTLSKGNKGSIIDEVFFMVFGLEGKAGVKNPEGYLNTHRQALDKLMALIVYMVNKNLVASFNEQSSFLMPASLVMESLADDDSLIICKDITHALKVAKNWKDSLTLSSQCDKASEEHTEQDSNEDGVSSTSISFDEDGNLQSIESFIDLVNLVSESIDHLAYPLNDTLETALGVLSITISNKLRLNSDNRKIA